jgi:hypothetical protein
MSIPGSLPVSANAHASRLITDHPGRAESLSALSDPNHTDSKQWCAFKRYLVIELLETVYYLCAIAWVASRAHSDSGYVRSSQLHPPGRR